MIICTVVLPTAAMVYVDFQMWLEVKENPQSAGTVGLIGFAALPAMLAIVVGVIFNTINFIVATIKLLTMADKTSDRYRSYSRVAVISLAVGILTVWFIFNPIHIYNPPAR